MYPAILLLMFTMQGMREGHIAEKLRRHLGVSQKTLERWAEYFREDFPHSATWQRVCGRVEAGVNDGDLPGSLLALFFQSQGEGEEGVFACLCFLATGLVEVRNV